MAWHIDSGVIQANYWVGHRRQGRGIPGKPLRNVLRSHRSTCTYVKKIAVKITIILLGTESAHLEGYGSSDDGKHDSFGTDDTVAGSGTYRGACA
jgi:hypothetical protein